VMGKLKFQKVKSQKSKALLSGESFN